MWHFIVPQLVNELENRFVCASVGLWQMQAYAEVSAAQ